MILAVALLINNLGLFILEVIGYHACHSGTYSSSQYEDKERYR